MDEPNGTKSTTYLTLSPDYGLQEFRQDDPMSDNCTVDSRRAVVISFTRRRHRTVHSSCQTQ